MQNPRAEAGTIRSSGFKFHSEAGFCGRLPLTTSSVMLLAAKLCVALQPVEGEATIEPGLVEPTVYPL